MGPPPPSPLGLRRQLAEPVLHVHQRRGRRLADHHEPLAVGRHVVLRAIARGAVSRHREQCARTIGISIGVGRAFGAITNRARTDWRAAAGPPTRSCASRAVGTAVTVGGERCRRGPIRRAGGTTAHAKGPRVVAGGRGRTQVTGGASAGGRGTRVDGGLRGPACAARAARVRRWVRIWSITAAWVMQATMRIAPWQHGHASGSTSKSCWRSAAVGLMPTGGWPRWAPAVARGRWPVARPRRRAPPCAACHGGGWLTSHRIVS